MHKRKHQQERNFHHQTTSQRTAQSAQQGRRPPCQTVTGNLYGQDHGEKPLRKNRGVNARENCNCGTAAPVVAQRSASTPCLRANRNLNGPRQSGPWGSLCSTTGKLKAWNQHDLQNRGIDHHVEGQTGSLYGRKDHGDKPRRPRQEDNDLSELQPRRIRSFLQSATTSGKFSTSCNCGTAKVFSTAAPENLNVHTPSIVGLQTREKTHREVYSTSNTSLAHATVKKKRVTVLLVQNSLDAEHLGPAPGACHRRGRRRARHREEREEVRGVRLFLLFFFFPRPFWRSTCIR